MKTASREMKTISPEMKTVSEEMKTIFQEIKPVSAELKSHLRRDGNHLCRAVEPFLPALITSSHDNFRTPTWRRLDCRDFE
jgi:hypothetical protein